MRVKVLSLFAVVLLVSACETTPEETAATEGVGEVAGEYLSPGVTRVSPPAPAKNTQQYLVSVIGDRVFFDFDKYNIKPAAAARLEGQAAWLKAHPEITVSIEGHCDERGTREYNLALGERRANAIKEYLRALGIDPNRVSTISYGKELPASPGSNKASWAQNRRGVMTVKP